MGEKHLNLGGQDYIITTILQNDNGHHEFKSNIQTADGSEIYPGSNTNQLGLGDLEKHAVSMFLYNNIYKHKK